MTHDVDINILVTSSSSFHVVNGNVLIGGSFNAHVVDVIVLANNTPLTSDGDDDFPSTLIIIPLSKPSPVPMWFISNIVNATKFPSGNFELS